jgi:preprotein translocase subunit SecA
LIDEIGEMTEAGRPVLVGTVSVAKSEILGEMLKRRGIKHEVLNAKFHEKESGIIAQAGRSAAVTIATNMAGRGTDIKLGGSPEGLASDLLHQRGLNPAEVDKETYEAALVEARTICDLDHERVVAAGGLHIIGTERHDSRRIDNQLRGRAGRQGDPGSSRFYLSLDDDLMKRFASDRVAGLMERMGLEDDVAIESRLVSKTIESAQTRVEGFNFDIRKRVVEFDDVINKQRETIYSERDKVLHNEDLGETIVGFLDEEIDALIAQYCAEELPEEWNIEGLSVAARAIGLDAEGTSEDELWDLGTRDAIRDHLRELVDARLAAKETEVGEADWTTIERVVLLRTIDSLWVEHLTELDDMRRGIGLRGYAQQDPLVEFRREAFNLYAELRGFIRHQLASSILRVQVTREEAPGPQPLPGPGQPGQLTGGSSELAASADGSAPPGSAGSNGASDGAVRTAAAGRAAATGSAAAAGNAILGSIARGLPPPPVVRGVRESLGDEVVGSGPSSNGSGALRPGFAPDGRRMGRNDVCFCGSGLKYKKCHGR